VPDTLATQVLIERVQHGDQEALNELCRRYQLRVLAAVRIRLGAGLRRKVESWDIVQEVLIDALRGVNKCDFGTDGAFLKWLNQVIENKIRDEADRQHAQKRNPAIEIPLDARSADSPNPLSQLAQSGVPTPSGVLVLREELETLELAMDKLGEENEIYRDLILAIELEQRTYQELAAEVGKTPDAIRVQFNRAKQELAKIFRRLESHT
jgi:RNA polymerase sigma-70 factor (subfamily 1)